MGLQNRFDPNDRFVWQFHYACMWCGKNQWDALHHIISPSSSTFIKGDFNSSILNSCPIHNDACHLYNSDLHKPEYEVKLLRKTYDALKMQGYRLTEKDREFIETYMRTHYKFICPGSGK